MNTSNTWPKTARLTRWGVIRVSGDDATQFLHQQLSQDILHLSAHEARLAAYCTAKGRVLASFIVVQALPQTLDLWCSLDLLPATLKRLQMFVLRAKVKLEDITTQHTLLGSLAPVGQTSDAGQPSQDWSVQPLADGYRITLPSVHTKGVDTGLLGRSMSLLAADNAVPASAQDTQLWEWLEVLSGIPKIEAANSEQFIPQMVNLDLVGGVNFKKGCYPGQEVVARSHYLGTMKRRMFLMASDSAVQSAQEVFLGGHPEQPCGRIVNAAQAPDGSYLALVELQLKVLAASGQAQAGLHAAQVDGPALHFQALPYALPNEEGG